MRILLLKPRYVFNSNHPVQFTGAECALPLSLAYLAAVGEKAGHQVRVLDFQLGEHSLADVLREFKPDVAGITAVSKDFPHAIKLMEELRGISPDMPLILGGPHANAYQEGIFSLSSLADYVVLHEGEATFIDLLDAISSGRHPSEVPGIIYKDTDGKGVRTPDRPFIKDLDALPFMALHHFKVGKYYPPAGTFRHLPSVTMITSRGCPFKCVFCNTDLFGKNVRLRSAGNVLDEVEEVVGRYRAREINFCDETLTINRDRMVAICEGIMRRGLKIGWKCSTRVDRVDPELLRLMKRSGCFYIGYGVESGVQRILDKMQKGITLEQIRTAFAETRKAGINTMAYFMMNVPGETLEDIEQSIRFSREIRPTYLNFELIKPYYGTALRQMIVDTPGIAVNEDLWEKWDHYSAGNHLFYVQEGVPEDKLRDAYARAVKGFYLRPGFILKAALGVRSLAQLRLYWKYFLNMTKVKMVG